MQRHILVPLDGSKLAEMALPHAVTMARSVGGDLTLLRAVPTPPAANPLAWAVPVNSTTWVHHNETLDIADEYLAGIAKDLESKGMAVQRKVVQGNPAEHIIRHVQQNADATMIVMATHGRSGLSRWLLGSVAEKVLQTSPAPLVLIRPSEEAAQSEVPVPETAGYSTILVPLDGSQLAEQALEQAQVIANATGATLLLVSVISGLEDLNMARRAESMRALEAAYEQEKQRLGSYLAATARQIEKAGINVQTLLPMGDAAEEILRAGSENGADLIVMSTHGRGGLERLWLGSVAIKVAHAAELPVLLIQADRKARLRRSAQLVEREQPAQGKGYSEQRSREREREPNGEPMAQRGRAMHMMHKV